jgi:hypothetical protein
VLNFWEYELNVPSEFTKQMDNLRAVITLFEQHDLQLRDLNSKIQVYSEDIYQFDEEEAVLKLLIQQNGLLVFWGASYQNINLQIFHKSDYPQYSRIIEPAQLSIGIDNTNYRIRDIESQALAQTIEQLYSDLVLLSYSDYGYMDNDLFELENNLNEPLPTLFPITYLSEWVLVDQPLDPVSEYIHHRKRINTGEMIFFSQYPWEISAKRMRELNRLWLGK